MLKNLRKIGKCLLCNNEETKQNEDYKTAFRKYRRKVNWETNKAFKNIPQLIDPHYKLLPRGQKLYHIDHIFSVYDGFKNNVPVEVISHWTNLCLIQARYNRTKTDKSEIKISVLYKNYKWGKETFGV